MNIHFSEKIDKNLINDPNLAKIGLLYRTKNYEKFVLNSINREINPVRVKHFIKEYKQRQIISPIEVMRDPIRFANLFF